MAERTMAESNRQRWWIVLAALAITQPACLLTNESVYYRDVPAVDATVSDDGDAVADDGGTDVAHDVIEASVDAADAGDVADVADVADAADVVDAVDDQETDAADDEVAVVDVVDDDTVDDDVPPDDTGIMDVAPVDVVIDDVPLVDARDVVLEASPDDAIIACSTMQQVCNGVCVDTATNPMNCGACNVTCPVRSGGGAPMCVGGQCVTSSTCPVGTAECDRNSATICETNTATDVSNCGGCNVLCPQGINATPVCTGGRCGLACTGSFADCDLLVTTGCEVDLASDPLHCGGCSVVCPPPPPNALPVCNGGSCDYQCSPHFNRTSTGCTACGGTLQPCCQSGPQCAVGLCNPLSLLCIVG